MFAYIFVFCYNAAQADEEENLRPWIPMLPPGPPQTKGVFWQFMEPGAAFATLELATDALHTKVRRLDL